MARALLVRVAFPGGVYRGGELGQPEELPSPARVHAAFVSAAGGGPAARTDSRVLVASEADREAVAWLESHPPLGLIAPAVKQVSYAAVRHRVRLAVDVKGTHDLHRDETSFEPFSAMAGPVVFAWPLPDPVVRERLAALATEITHVGRADSTAVVAVIEGEFDASQPGALTLAAGRGPGQVLRVAQPGRFDALVDAHRRSTRLAGARHGAGLKSKQARDEPVAGAADRATALCRFEIQAPVGNWPYEQLWEVPFESRWPARSMEIDRRVATAVSVHRALVAAIGDDVPSFVTGRDGEGPLIGTGHLTIQFARAAPGEELKLWLGIPPDVPAADRAELLTALESGPVVRVGRRLIRLGAPQRIGSALDCWPQSEAAWATEVPLVLDAPGTPRHGPWTLDDAVVCSVGYAMRGPLERSGLPWGNGWEFRGTLVRHLRERGVHARAFRVTGPASRYVHRGREGDLLVAAHAVVRLGELDPGGRGLLALGRARHLGGGLLRPLAGGA